MSVCDVLRLSADGWNRSVLEEFLRNGEPTSDFEALLCRGEACSEPTRVLRDPLR